MAYSASPNTPRPDEDILNGLAPGNPQEVKAIGMKRLRAMCLTLQASFKDSQSGQINANAFRVVMVDLPQTFGYMSPEVHIVDVALEKWFVYAKRETSKNIYSAAAIGDVVALTGTIKSFCSFVAQCNWLRKNDDNRLERVIGILRALYEYCRHWGYAKNKFGDYGSYARRHYDISDGAPPESLGSEGVEAFRALYEQCKGLQDNVIKHIMSVDFAREMARKQIAADRRRDSGLMKLLDHIVGILRTIGDFDMRGAADMWKCMTKLATDHIAAIVESCSSSCSAWTALKKWQTDVIKMLLSDNIQMMVERAVFAPNSEDNGEFRDRNMKLANFYAKILLRLYTVIGPHRKFNVFVEFVGVFQDLRKKLQKIDGPQAKALIGLFEEIVPHIYGHGLSRYYRSRIVYLDLYIIIYNLLLSEQNPEVIASYAEYAFGLTEVADLLHKISLEYTADCTDAVDHYRGVVARLSALTVLTAHRFPTIAIVLDSGLLTAIRTADQFFAGILAFDVWQVRCAFLSPDQRLHYLRALFTHKLGKAALCYRPASVFGRALMCSFYDSLPSAMQASFCSEHFEEKSRPPRYAYDDVETRVASVLPVWGVLGADRIADPTERARWECIALEAYEKVAAESGQQDNSSNVYKLQMARHALHGNRQPKALAILDEMCANLHIHVPTLFAWELHHLLNNASALGVTHVMATLEQLAAYFAKRQTEPTDTMVRLLTIDFLRNVSTFEIVDEETRPKFVQLYSDLLGVLVAKPKSMYGKDDVVVRTFGLRMFAEIGARMKYDEIIVRTLRQNVSIKADVERVLNKERLPAVAALTDKLFLRDVRYEHVCKKGLQMSTGDVQKVIVDLRANIQLIDRIRQNGSLLNEQLSVELKMAEEEFKLAMA